MLPSSRQHKVSVLRAARGMPAQVGALLQWLSQLWVGSVPDVGAAPAASIRELHKQGCVVYVHRSRNAVDVLILWQWLLQRGLPLVAYVAEKASAWMQPLRLLFLGQVPPGMPRERSARECALLRAALSERRGAMIFLRRPLTLGQSSRQPGAQYIETLVLQQRAQRSPIFLLPQLVVYGQQPGHFVPTLGDTVFGSPEEPGRLRALLRIIARRRRAHMLTGQPVNLQKMLADQPEADDCVIARKVRWTLLHYLSREDQAYNGPRLKSPARVREEALRDPTLQRSIEQMHERQGLSRELLTRQARANLSELAARYDINAVNFLDAVLRFTFGRIYDGIDVSEADMERLRDAMRTASVVLAPSHRSHVDYLILSQLMAHHGLIPPHIAAGINLSFWPVGPIFRRAGAYFIRRSFKGDPLYALSLRAYLKRLIRDGFVQEFFIEGTRSRNGKSLQPKLGLLSMLVDAQLEMPRHDLLFVPVAIGYEKVIEEREYQRELAGASKQGENVAGLIKATRVLRSRFGRVHVTLGEPISLRAWIRDRGLGTQIPSDEERRRLVAELGQQLVHCIDRITPVTATAVTAMALLGHPRPLLKQATLLRYVQRILDHIHLVSEGRARLAPSLAQAEAAAREACQRLVDEGALRPSEVDGEPAYRIVVERRVLMDRYKNSILHYFFAEAVVAKTLAALTTQDKPIAPTILCNEACWFDDLLALERIVAVGDTFAARFDRVVQRARNSGTLKQQVGGLSRPDAPLANELHAFVANLLSPVVEAYWVALRHLATLPEAGQTQRDLIASIHEAQRRALATGEIFYPEAVSKVYAGNAVQRLKQLGALVSAGRDGRDLKRSPEWPASRLLAAADRLTRYLPE